MKKIDTSQISDPLIQQPFTGLSLNFLQNANKEMVHSICRNLVALRGYTYSPTVPYFVSRFTTTGIDPSFTSDGCVFYGGELYVMLENVTSAPYAVIDTTPDSVADPLLFPDSVNRNVHNNRYLNFQSSSSGALFPVADLIDLTSNNSWINITPATNWTVPATYITASNAFQYRLNNLTNEIEFRGFVKNTDTGATVTLFTLPSGKRPSYDIAYTVWASGAPSGSVYTVELIIFANGSVNAYVQGLANNTVINLNGVRFSMY